MARRSNALLAAKVGGRHVGEMIAGLLAARTNRVDGPELIADIGCGTGRPARTLARRFPRAEILAIDASAPMLREARTHLRHHLAEDAHRISYLQADFHRLPLGEANCQAAVAAFCLYHTPHPTKAVAEIARTLVIGGTAILVTKSADSYHELDELLAATGLDPHATTRPSLYASASSTVLPAQVATALTVESVISDHHVFCFRDARHLAAYLSTVPKYELAAPLRSDPQALSGELRRRRGNGPLLTTSTITYVIARRSP
ncbi:class I SAM-dependent methyltransferase [Actinomadura sp. SCN-SB]|uniref:class I SAM-dependent methyltransferase n=1 Tax=Actinomadura sp. SCN-SB TaxID=3373092 RepID=UPI0037530234